MKKFINQLDNRLGHFYVPFILVVMSLVLFLIGYPFVKQTEVVVSLNSVATQTIRAGKTVEDVDATEKARENAAKTVQPVYEKDETIVSNKIEQVTTFFKTIAKYRKELLQTTDTAALNEQANRFVSTFVSSLQNENKKIYDYAYVFSDNVLKKLLSASETEFTLYETLTKSILETVLKDEIYSSPTDLAKARSEANSLILTKTYSDTARDMLNDVVSPAIVATMVVNQEATENARKMAREAVSPVFISQGDVIVREGEVIGNAVYRKLQLLGMTTNSYNFHLLIGYILILATQFGAVWYFIAHQADTSSKQSLYVNLYAFMMIVMVGLTVLADLVQKSGVDYFALTVPLAIVPFFIITKAKRRLAILAISFLITIYFFLGDNGVSLQVPVVWKFYTLTGLFSTVVVTNKKSIFKNHFMILFTLYVSFITALALFSNIEFMSQTYGLMLLYAIVNVCMTLFVLRVGKPYFDLLFEDKAVLRLLELSNPNQPLLKELIAKAPGTYHHSIMVANLSANAVELIGGDSLFTRVASYYHDIGKLKNPMFFVENLPSGMENPHKLLTPQESRDIIFEHVTDGMRRLKEMDMPKGFIDICAQHHGTTVLKYFYVTAKNADDTVEEEDFRYPGPKPQTKEAAVVNIADTVEAAARAMNKPDYESISQLVKDTIYARIADGQFDNCPITVEELKIVEASLIAGLSSSYHNRVEYPKLNSRKGKKN